MNRVILQDCLEAMREMPDKCFDLAVCDVPYGINIARAGKIGNCNPFGGKKSFGVKNTKRKIIASTDYGKKKWDSNSPNQEYFNELIRVSKNQILWGANHFISKIPFDSPCWLVWDKENSGNYADCELAWTSFTSVVKKFDFRWNGMLQGNMKDKELRIHPTQKPVALYDFMFQNYATKGMRILDTHGGSMSSVISAMKNEMEITCYEIDEDYFNAGKKRIKNYLAQGNMFQQPQIEFITKKQI